MSVEENKALMARFTEEVINRKNLAIVDELVASDFVEHEELSAEAGGGREGIRQNFGMLFGGFPDLQATIEDMVAEGDRVALRSTMRGTHEGDFMGIPPTGKTAAYVTFDIVHIRHGKITDHWGLSDSMALMQQLGVTAPVDQGSQVP
jgi:steroid delta-isomerase-like uncharacterized protein